MLRRQRRVGGDAKRGRALALLRQGEGLSVQVLQEFYYQATRPGRPAALTPEQALRFLDSLDDFPVQPVTPGIFRAGVSISRRFGLSYWDAAILAAARALGCDAVYSEDDPCGRPAGRRPGAGRQKFRAPGPAAPRPRPPLHRPGGEEDRE